MGSALPAPANAAFGVERTRRDDLAGAAALALGVLALAACGGGQATDAGGFTAAQRAAAQSALRLVAQTAIPRRVLALSFQAGTAPSTCTVLPAQGRQGSFRLLVAWVPDLPGYLTLPQSVLAATIDASSPRKDSFDVVTFRDRRGRPLPTPVGVRAGFVRAALTKPAEQCQVLDDGALELVAP